MQRCVDHATGVERERLVEEVASNALALSQDPFGNYVVQYVLELGLTAPSAKVSFMLSPFALASGFMQASALLSRLATHAGNAESESDTLQSADCR